MHRSLATITLAAVLMGPSPHASAQDDTVLIAWREGPRVASAVSRLAAQGYRRVRVPVCREAPETWRVPAGTEAEMGAAALRRNPAVRVAEVNRRRSLAERIPNDPLFVNSWPLLNPGGAVYPPATGNPPSTADADIDATDAWERTTGSPEVVVAVLDTGITLDHPDLAANLWTNADEVPGNGLDDDFNGYVDDIHGYDTAADDATPEDVSGISHGTFVSGIVGMAGDNGTGSAGVCWRVSLMPVRVFGQGHLSDVIEGMDYATMNGADVINASYGGFGFSGLEREAIARAAAADVVFVAATGNDSEDMDLLPFYPACHDLPNLIAVGASTPQDTLASFSNWGWNTADLAAPGLPIFSTVKGADIASSFRWNGGTSFAAPHASGVAALLRSLHPDMSAREIVERMRAGADRPAALAETARTGGRLNANQVWSGDTTPPAAVNDLHAVDVASHGARLAFTAPGDDGMAGQAARWDVRFSDEPLSDANWDSAIRAWDVPAPGPPASEVPVPLSRWSLGSLEPNTVHFAGVRAIDEAGNRGPVGTFCAFTTRGETTLFFDDFETDSGAWTAQAPWQRTDQTDAASGSFCYHDSVSPPNYAPSTDASLTLAPIDLTGTASAELRFATQHDFVLSPLSLLDAGVVEVSTDGASWERAMVFHGTSSPHRTFRLPLGRWAGEPAVQLRWRLFSDSTNTVAEGWWIDDVRVAVPEAPVRSTPDVVVESEGIGLSPALLDSFRAEDDGGLPWAPLSAKAALPVLAARRSWANPISPERGATATFRPWIPVSGRYEVAIAWPAEANAAQVTVHVAHSGGTSEAIVSQDDANANAWISVGSHHFRVGSAGAVTLDESSVTGPVDAGRAGQMVADAARWRLVEADEPPPEPGISSGIAFE